MKRFLVRSLSVLLSLVAVFLLFNIRDERKRGDVGGGYSFAPVTPDAANAFSYVYLFAAPPAEDIFAPGALAGLRQRYADALAGRLDEGTARAEYNRAVPLQRWGRRLMQVREKISAASWPQGYLEIEAQIRDFEKNAGFLADRYQRLMAMPQVQDFSFPGLYFPYLNVFLLQDCSRYWVVQQMVDAAKGRWREAVPGLLRQIRFGRSLMRQARRRVVNRIGLEIVQSSLRALAVLQASAHCPPAMLQLVTSDLAPLTYADSGEDEVLAYAETEFAYFLESLQRERDLRPLFRGRLQKYFYLYYSFEGMLGSEKRRTWMVPLLRIFLQQNATQRIFADYCRDLALVARQAPGAWRLRLADLNRIGTQAALWWLRNPIGKIALHAWAPPPERLLGDFLVRYAVQAEIDLLRIAAAARLVLKPGHPLSSVVATLADFHAMDPFSGRPYIVDDGAGIIRSSGWQSVVKRLGMSVDDLPDLPPLRVQVTPAGRNQE